MRDIILKMTGSQRASNCDEEKIEFITEGKLYKRNDSFYVLYDETEVTGIEGCQTTLKYNADGFRVRRTGENLIGKYTVIEFAKNKCFNSLYNTPVGSIGMEVLTRKIDMQVDEEGFGVINIDYDVNLKGLTESKNSMNIEIKKRGKNEPKNC